jgi:hypothetical protein
VMKTLSKVSSSTGKCSAQQIAAETLLAQRRFSKVRLQIWRLLGCRPLVSACRDSLGHSIRIMQGLRRAPRHGGVHVLELQAGSTLGLMASLALRAGASRVLCCDTDPNVVDLCCALASVNGLTPRGRSGAPSSKNSGSDGSSDDDDDNETGISVPESNNGLRFSDKHPSTLVCGDAVEGVPRPVDLIILPLPEQGLFAGGLLKLLRAVQLNSILLATDGLVFPARVSLFAQVVELTFAVTFECDNGGAIPGALDCSGALPLMPPSTKISPLPLNLAKTPHRALCSPVCLLNTDLASVIRRASPTEPSSMFMACVGGIPVHTSGNATAIVWWWNMALCASGRPSLAITNAPGIQASPWNTQVHVCIQFESPST